MFQEGWHCLNLEWHQYFHACLALLWYCHESHSYSWTKGNFRDSETGIKGVSVLSTNVAPKLIWGADLGNIWSLVVAAVFWHSDWCSKRLAGRAASLFCGQKGSLGPGARSKMGTVVSEATSRCQLAAEGHSIASLADQCQLHHSSRWVQHSVANLESAVWKWKLFWQVMILYSIIKKHCDGMY